MQFWPRKRTVNLPARIRSWVPESKVKPLGFIAFKAGMTHIQAVDNYPRSMTKGENIVIPTTILECPPMGIAGVCFYKNTSLGFTKVATVLAPNLPKELSRRLPLPKKATKKLEEVTDFEDLRLLVYSNPKLTSVDSKNPQMLEVALGGSKEEKISYVKEKLGKEILVTDIFENGLQVDVHGISKGKGVQGTVKRYGVPLRQHKAEKTKRGIATLGSWTPKRVEYTVPQSGKMGYHLRTELNKQIIKIDTKTQDVNPAGGLNRYGVVKNTYILLDGSVVGPKKRAVVLTLAARPSKKIHKDAPELVAISTRG